MNSTPKLTVLKKQQNYGLYVWRTPEGVVSDPDGNIMNIPAREGDLSAMSQIRQAAIHYGFPEGQPEFRAGVRRVSEEEYSEQLERMKEGHIPSETDIGAWADAAKGIETHGDE